MMTLFGVWWCSNMICVASTFDKVKKSSLRKTSSVSKEEVASGYARLHFTQTESHETNIGVESPSEWASPVVETSESIEPNDNDLELNAIGYKFSTIL